MKRWLGFIIGVVIIAVAAVVMLSLRPEQKEVQETVQKMPTVTVVQPIMESVPQQIQASGVLYAQEQIDLFSEVQGTFNYSAQPFKKGVSYKRGQVLISIDATEFNAQVRAARSNFINLVTSAMPDLELDYPDHSPVWKNYLNSLNLSNGLPELPGITDQELGYFINGKNITRTFYDVKNLESRLAKYQITAPYAGTLVEANVNLGALVRSGQQLGSFVKSSDFEFEVKVPVMYKQSIEVGQMVLITNLDKDLPSGKVIRIVPLVEQDSQSLSVIISVPYNNQLAYGQYVSATIEGEDIDNVIVMDRNLLQNGNQVYIVESGQLQLKNVEIISESGDQLIIKGLEETDQIVTQAPEILSPGTKVETSK